MMTTLVSIVLLLCGVLAVFWHRSLGITRAFMAAACRAGWVIPLILSLVPEILNEQLPRSLALQTINVLVDDSDSMRDKDFDGSGIKGKVHDFLKTLDHQCLQYGCMPRVAKLSEMHDDLRHLVRSLNLGFLRWVLNLGF